MNCTFVVFRWEYLAFHANRHQPPRHAFPQRLAGKGFRRAGANPGLPALAGSVSRSCMEAKRSVCIRRHTRLHAPTARQGGDRYVDLVRIPCYDCKRLPGSREVYRAVYFAGGVMAVFLPGQGRKPARKPSVSRRSSARLPIFVRPPPRPPKSGCSRPPPGSKTDARFGAFKIRSQNARKRVCRSVPTGHAAQPTARQRGYCTMAALKSAACPMPSIGRAKARETIAPIHPVKEVCL